jgi:hypothetical protein
MPFSNRRPAPRLVAFLFAAWCCCAFLISAGGADAADPAGYIAAIEGEPGRDLRIERDGRSVAPLLFDPVYAGDRIAVLTARGAVTLETADDPALRIGLDDSPHVVSGALAADGEFAGIMDAVSGLLAARPAPAAVNLLGRAGDAAGDLAFRGGFGARQAISGALPLRIAVDPAARGLSLRLDDRPPVGIAIAGGAATVALPQGVDAADLILTMADDQEIALRLVRTERPSPPPSLLAAAPSPALRDLAEAVWLSRRAEGAWRAEAIAILARRPDHPALRAARERLEAGGAL